MVVEMQMLALDIGDLPAFAAEQQDREMDRQAIVAVLNDGFLFLGIFSSSCPSCVRIGMKNKGSKLRSFDVNVLRCRTFYCLQ